MSTPKFQSVAPIRAESVAKKLAAIRNMEYPDLHEQVANDPRLVELLWFVQYTSMQPGGIGKFCAELLYDNRNNLRTARMLEFGTPTNDRYSVEQTHQILRSVPQKHDFGTFEMREYLRGGFAADQMLEALTEDEWNEPGEATRRREAAARQKERIEDELGKISYVELCDAVYKAASIDLPHYLAALCTEERGFEAPWYFPELFTALFVAMQSQSARVSATIAMTEVAQQVFDTLDYARSESGMVEIIGDSRFGKTQSLKAWCAMRPGIARLISVPSSNCETDLFKAIGAALGITYGIAPDTHQLKDRIEFVVRHGGLMLVFDEAHFLWPMKYTKTTAPARLNWLRTELVDKGIPVALCYTPQAWDHVRATFLRTTKYATEQFLGRRLLQKILPKELSKSDLQAVARIHFPDLDADFLDYIVETARASEGYIATMEAVAKRVRYKAQSKRGKVTFADIQSATDEVAPELATSTTLSVPTAEQAATPNKRRKTVLTADSRGVKPQLTEDVNLRIEKARCERFSVREAEVAAA